ncbi:MAG: GNAT family N-acetyltransferase [Alphaproteobacteria bacterium]
MRKFTVRRAVPDDAPTIASQMDALNRHFDMDEPPVDPETFRPLMEGADPFMTAYIASSDEDVVVGYALCQKFFDTDTGTMATWLLDLHVNAGVRGNGVGRMLMARAASDARAKGQRCLGLAVYRDNPARRLYERLGGALSPEALVYEIRDSDLETLAGEAQI